MNTLFLEPNVWDLAVDVSGNIAVASKTYALAQDAASAIRTFQGELWYDTTQGVPYWQQILGHYPQMPLVKSYMVYAALTVPEITDARVYFSALGSNRQLVGQVQVTNSAGQTAFSGF